MKTFKDSCETTTLFDANNYLLSTIISNNLNVDQKKPQAVKIPNSKDLNDLVQTYVEYFNCAYTSFIDNIDLNIKTQAEAIQPTDTCSECRDSSFIFDKIATNSCIINQTDVSPSRLTLPLVFTDYAHNDLSKCTRLALITSPNKPSFNNNRCKDTVTQVKYVIFWKDQQIVRVLSRVVTSDILLDNLKIKQSFELKWYPYDDTKLGLITTMSDFESYLNSRQVVEGMLSGYSGTVLNLLLNFFLIFFI